MTSFYQPAAVANQNGNAHEQAAMSLLGMRGCASQMPSAMAQQQCQQQQQQQQQRAAMMYSYQQPMHFLAPQYQQRMPLPLQQQQQRAAPMTKRKVSSSTDGANAKRTATRDAPVPAPFQQVPMMFAASPFPATPQAVLMQQMMNPYAVMGHHTGGYPLFPNGGPAPMYPMAALGHYGAAAQRAQMAVHAQQAAAQAAALREADAAATAAQDSDSSDDAADGPAAPAAPRQAASPAVAPAPVKRTTTRPAPAGRSSSTSSAPAAASKAKADEAGSSPYPFNLPLAFRHNYNRNGRIGIYAPTERKQLLERYFAKRQRRNWGKVVAYACRKNLAQRRVRVKGRFIRRAPNDGHLLPEYLEQQKAAAAAAEQKQQEAAVTAARSGAVVPAPVPMSAPLQPPAAVVAH